MDNDLSSKNPAEVRVGVEGDCIVIAVRGLLDGKAVSALSSATTCAFNCQCKHVRVDLREVTGFTEGGAAGLAVMQSLLPPDRARRVTYHASSEVAQDALLASYARSA